MRFFDKAFNGMVDVMRWILRLEPASADVEKTAAVYWSSKNGELNYRAVKVMTRADSHERVRIVQNGQYYGSILDFRHPRLGWSPGHILRDGIICSSPEQAEAEARVSVPWLADWKELAAPAEPERVQTPRISCGSLPEAVPGGAERLA